MSKQTVVIDTNILLELFVFQDPAVEKLREQMQTHQVIVVVCQRMEDEFSSVIARDKFGPQTRFGLSAERQGELLGLWRSFTTQVSSESIERSPWRCKDQDDQIFLDLAFTLKPAWLISKDHQVLKFRKRAARDGVIITSVYTGQ